MIGRKITASLTIQMPYKDVPWSRQSAIKKLQRVNNRREALNAKNPGKCKLGLPTNTKVTTLETSSWTKRTIGEQTVWMEV